MLCLLYCSFVICVILSKSRRFDDFFELSIYRVFLPLTVSLEPLDGFHKLTTGKLRARLRSRLSFDALRLLRTLRQSHVEVLALSLSKCWGAWTLFEPILWVLRSILRCRLWFGLSSTLPCYSLFLIPHIEIDFIYKFSNTLCSIMLAIYGSTALIISSWEILVVS